MAEAFAWRIVRRQADFSLGGIVPWDWFGRRIFLWLPLKLVGSNDVVIEIWVRRLCLYWFEGT